jgi:6,7-dimethyl-8-ribityllumazine synthase
MANIAVIQSCWHKDIVDQFRASFAEHIQTHTPASIEVIEAPGVVEIPLLTKLAAQSGQFDAIVVTGLIVDHGVYRHEFVAQSVMDSIMGIQVETEVPVIYGILTAQDFMSEGREQFFYEHFVVKGQEAANACAKTLDNIARLRTSGELSKRAIA